jgi:hypothetical protein
LQVKQTPLLLAPFLNDVICVDLGFFALSFIKSGDVPTFYPYSVELPNF